MTVNDVYTEVADALLEPLPAGLSLGAITEEMFLSMFQNVIQDFLQQTGLVKKIFPLEVTAATSSYTEPDACMSVHEVFYNEKFLHRETELDLDALLFKWPSKSSAPQGWHEDRLGVKTIQLYPSPTATGYTVTVTPAMYGTLSATASAVTFSITPSAAFYGTLASFSGPVYVETTAAMLGTFQSILTTDANLMLVGSSKPTRKDWVLTDIIEDIPETFRGYLKYGVLLRIFSLDGETKDQLRAKYAQARWEEGVRLAQAITQEEMEEE